MFQLWENYLFAYYYIMILWYYYMNLQKFI